MRGEFVKYSKKTAKHTPMMVVREFERVITEKRNYVNGLIKKLEQLQITVIVKNETKVNEENTPPGKGVKFNAKLSELIISAQPFDKERRFNPRSENKKFHGIDALEWLYNNQEKQMSEIKSHRAVLAAMEAEKISFILKYTG